MKTYRSKSLMSAFALAFFLGTVASGQESIVSGQGPITSGQEANVSGQGPITSGQVANVSGQGPIASGQGAVVSGQEAILSGQEAMEPAEPVLDNLFTTIPVPEGIDRNTAMRTCVNAAIGREWNIASKTDGLLKINLRHRSWDATVYFVVKDDVIEMYSDSYEVNKKTGERKKKKDPDGWLKYLEKDINLNLKITFSDLQIPGSSEPVLDNLVETIEVPAGIDRKTAVDTCVNAAIGRGWHVVSKGDDLIRINLKQRNWNATIYLMLKGDEIEMYSDSYVVHKKTGERAKKKDPDLWIKNLRQDIKSRFDHILYSG